MMVAERLETFNVPGIQLITSMEWGVELEVLVDGVVVSIENDVNVTVSAKTASVRMPYLEINVTVLGQPVPVENLELLLILTGHYRQDPSPALRWTSQLTAHAHDEQPYDAAGDTCSMDMVCDGLHTATATYTRWPRAWTGLRVRAGLLGIRRALQE